MTRESLASWHQERAAELYAYARWAAGKAMKQRLPFVIGAANLYYVRRNQAALDAEMAAMHAATARLLMGIDDAL